MTTIQRVPFVDLSAQYETIKADVTVAMDKVLRNCNFILGQQVADFEQAFARYCDVPHAVGVDSGTTALELLLRAHGVGAGDEVIIQANTFIATAIAITRIGAKPVLVDCIPETYEIDTTQLEAAITPRTVALMPVHLYGHPADMDPIMAIAERHNLIVIEDASQAHGARYKGQRVGSIGHSAAFSLYPAKNLGAYGDAGIIVTKDADIAQKVRLLRNYGSVKKYHHDSIGYNHRLDTLQAAVLCVKLPYMDEWNRCRRKNAALYDQFLADTSLELPQTAEGAEPVYHLYVVRVEQREAFREAMQAAGISTGVHYPIPIHMQPAYEFLGYQAGDFPVTERDASRIVSLPMYAELSEEQVRYVAETVGKFEAGNQ